MARKTFISYKYTDVVEGKGTNNLRDKIIKKLGDDARYYKGESGYSKDLSSYTASYIKELLKDMIYDSSVTIVIISPNMKLSNWIEWEIEYSLRDQPRNGRYSHPNGIVAVVQKQEYFYNDGYAWFKNGFWNTWDESLLPSIIQKKRRNKKYYASPNLSEHYIDIVTEDDFLRNPQKYIENAYEKSQNFNSYN